jgi:putative transferase (TIGR04331 family)
LKKNLKSCAALVLNDYYWKNKNLIFFNRTIHTLSKENTSNKNIKLEKNFNISKKKQIKLDSFFKKKFKYYKKQLIFKLNKYHNLDENEIYWGKIIDIWLIEIIIIIKLRYEELKFCSKKNSFYLNGLDKIQFPFLSNYIYQKANYSSDLNQFIYSKISDTLKIPKKKIKNNNFLIETINKIKKVDKFINFFVLYYVKFFKPSVLVDSYFNFKEKIKIFLLSKGKIIFFNSKYFFNIKNDKSNADLKGRKLFNFPEKDNFDKVFNSVIFFFLPLSFLENFKFIKKNISGYSSYIKKIGTSVSVFSCDFYNILVAEMYKNKKKSILFAHGEADEIRTYDLRNSMAIKNSDLHISFGNKNGYGISGIRRLNSIFRYKKENILYICQANPIHHYTTFRQFKDFEFSIYNNFRFYNNLDKEIKSKLILRVSPTGHQYENKTNFAKDIIKEKFNEVRIDPDTNIKKLFLKSIVVVSTYISTNVFEALYLDKPTIIIASLNDYSFNRKALSFFNKFKNAGILHNNPEKAALFLNKNILNIDKWWQSRKIREILRIFKREYCVDNKYSCELLVKKILEKS